VFIDLTLGEEAEEVAEKVAQEAELMRNQLESESDASSEMDVSSDDEREVPNENEGMNGDFSLLMNSGGGIVNMRTSCKNASGPPDQVQRVSRAYTGDGGCDWYGRICGGP